MSFEFFTNHSCEYFPCHSFSEINCLFCFCPLYSFSDCGGKYCVLDNGLKDCSSCELPHGEDGYDCVIKFLKERNKMNEPKPTHSFSSEEIEKLRLREPTRLEMLKALGDKDETFYDGWTVRRCVDCGLPVAGGPTRCDYCAGKFSAFADLSTEDLQYLFEDFKDREELTNEVWRLREKVLYLQEEKQELQSQVDDLKYDNEKLVRKPNHVCCDHPDYIPAGKIDFEKTIFLCKSCGKSLILGENGGMILYEPKERKNVGD
jgi:Zn-finger protein